MGEHLRNIGSAVAGYVTMAICVMALMSGLWMVLGADGAFKSESWEISGAWSFGSIIVGLLAGLAGGLVCSKVAADRRGVWMLLVLVVVLGVAVAVGEFETAGMGVSESPSAGGTRPADVSMTEAMMSAQQPVWLAWLNPVLGVIGVLLGARGLKGR